MERPPRSAGLLDMKRTVSSTPAYSVRVDQEINLPGGSASTSSSTWAA
jgi:hypothetical protein